MGCLSLTAGKVAIFKAVVSGDPAPSVTWARNKGDTSDPEKYKPRYDERTREHVLEVTHLCQKFESEITFSYNTVYYDDGSFYAPIIV